MNLSGVRGPAKADLAHIGYPLPRIFFHLLLHVQNSLPTDQSSDASARLNTPIQGNLYG